MLSAEAAVQQLVPLNTWIYYVFVFSGTVVYYTEAYMFITVAEPHNKRSMWYLKHLQRIKVSQLLLTIVFGISGMALLYFLFPNIRFMNLAEVLSILLFPATAALYYGLGLPSKSRFTLRNKGWLKPFVIGFVWSGLVTVYPVMFQNIINGISFQITFFGTLLFVKNFMYITVLCIMFDIKDYAADHNKDLKTFVVRVGLRKTIFYVLLPLSIIGLTTFLVYAVSLHFPVFRIAINTIPFILLLTAAYSMHKRKSILYYLAIIDGLMLVKACCGIAGMAIY
jgi:4-hydroxybenzoate polyprenyltransferase